MTQETSPVLSAKKDASKGQREKELESTPGGGGGISKRDWHQWLHQAKRWWTRRNCGEEDLSREEQHLHMPPTRISVCRPVRIDHQLWGGGHRRPHDRLTVRDRKAVSGVTATNSIAPGAGCAGGGLQRKAVRQ